jgi:hypothetical protein
MVARRSRVSFMGFAGSHEWMLPCGSWSKSRTGLPDAAAACPSVSNSTAAVLVLSPLERTSNHVTAGSGP